VAGFIWWQNNSTPTDKLPSLLPDEVPSAVPSEAASAAASAAPSEAASAAPTGPVVLTAQMDKLWIKVSDANGKQLIQKQLAMGETYTVPEDAAEPRVWTGRPESWPSPSAVRKCLRSARCPKSSRMCRFRPPPCWPAARWRRVQRPPQPRRPARFPARPPRLSPQRRARFAAIPARALCQCRGRARGRNHAIHRCALTPSRHQGLLAALCERGMEQPMI
jgi:hypothetical protein